MGHYRPIDRSISLCTLRHWRHSTVATTPGQRAGLKSRAIHGRPYGTQKRWIVPLRGELPTSERRRRLSASEVIYPRAGADKVWDSTARTAFCSTYKCGIHSTTFRAVELHCHRSRKESLTMKHFLQR